MKILVTGGAGFIGSHLVEALLAEGHQVRALDNLSTGSLENLESFIKNPNFQFIEGDILSEPQIRNAFSGVHLVYHLAAAVGVKYVIDNPLESIHTNVLGTENILRLAYLNGSKVILTSTSEVYGKNDADRLREDADRILGETNITRWSYSSSKALDEFIAFAYYRKHGLPVSIARLFNTCGPRQSSRYGMVIPRFVKQALAGKPITVYGDGRQVRAFTHVRDTVRALLCLGFSENAFGEVFNVGNERTTTTILELAHRVKEITSSSSPVHFISYEEAYETGFEDMIRRVPDVTKIREYVGFTAELLLDDILSDTIFSLRGKHELQNT